MKKKQIDVKNYVIYAILVVCTMLIVFYLGSWYQKTNSNIEEKAIISSVLSEVKKNELGNYLVENPNTILYVITDVNSEEQEVLKEVVTEYNLRDSILFLTLKEKEKSSFEKDYLEKTKVSYPNLLVFEEGKYITSFQDSYTLFTKDNFVSFLKNYGVIVE